MSGRIISALLLLVIGFCLLIVPAQASAKDLIGSTCARTGTDSSAACTDNGKTDAKQDPFSGPNGLLAKITNIVAYLGGALAIIMIIVGAFRFASSGSDASTSSRTDTDVEAARQTITNAIIGLVVIVLGRELIFFVLNRL